MKKLVTIALAVVIGLGGFKLYIHTQLKNDINQYVEALAPIAQIQYQSLSTSLIKQSLTLHHIEVLPTGSLVPMTVKKISLYDVRFLSNKGNWLSNMDWSKPSDQGFSLKKLSVDLNDLQKNKALLNLAQSNGADVEWLLKLGYSELVLDLDMSISNNPKQKQMTVHFQQAQKDMFDLTLKATLQPNLDEPPATPMRALSLVSAQLAFSDHSFINRYFKYLANKDEKTIQEVKQQWLDAFKDQLAEKELKLEEQQSMAIKNLILEEQPLFVNIHPAKPMSRQTISTLHLYKPMEVLNMLRLSVSNQESFAINESQIQ